MKIFTPRVAGIRLRCKALCGKKIFSQTHDVHTGINTNVAQIRKNVLIYNFEVNDLTNHYLCTTETMFNPLFSSPIALIREIAGAGNSARLKFRDL